MYIVTATLYRIKHPECNFKIPNNVTFVSNSVKIFTGTIILHCKNKGCFWVITENLVCKITVKEANATEAYLNGL